MLSQLARVAELYTATLPVTLLYVFSLMMLCVPQAIDLSLSDSDEDEAGPVRPHQDAGSLLAGHQRGRAAKEEPLSDGNRPSGLPTLNGATVGGVTEGGHAAAAAGGSSSGQTQTLSFSIIVASKKEPSGFPMDMTLSIDTTDGCIVGQVGPGEGRGHSGSGREPHPCWCVPPLPWVVHPPRAEPHSLTGIGAIEGCLLIPRLGTLLVDPAPKVPGRGVAMANHWADWRNRLCPPFIPRCAAHTAVGVCHARPARVASQQAAGGDSAAGQDAPCEFSLVCVGGGEGGGRGGGNETLLH